MGQGQQLPTLLKDSSGEALPGLHPYFGSRVKEHFGAGEIPHKTWEYGHTGAQAGIEFRFNSAGYRCDEFNPGAAAKIFVSGCSHTFGEGLRREDTWPVRFAELYAEKRGLPPSEVCLMNFAAGGACNEYIATSLMIQANLNKPDLILAHFTDPSRTQFYVPQAWWRDLPPIYRNLGALHIGPWVTDRGWRFRRATTTLAGGPLSKDQLRHVLKWSEDFYRRFNMIQGVVALLQSMVTLQSYCQAHRIPYVFAATAHRRLKEYIDHPVAGPLLGLLDLPRLCDLSIMDDRLDQARDNMHGGPETNRAFAKAMFSKYEQLNRECQA